MPWDWYGGEVPENVVLGRGAFLETTYSFFLHRSTRSDAIEIGSGASVYKGCMFDTGPDARIRIGHLALLNGVWLIADDGIEIGDNALVSWNVVIMDTLRFAADPVARHRELGQIATRRPRRPASMVEPSRVVIEDNVWIGFDCCVLPGVRIGEGSVVGARSVVVEDIPPYTIAAGNPARAVRGLERTERGPNVTA
jgi:acetyltransferase-like isoleucine patch superfamily enzyme